MHADEAVPIAPSTLGFAQLFSRHDYKSSSSSAMINSGMFSGHERTKEKKEIIPLTVLKGVTIQTLWNDLFASNAIMQEYHDKRKEKDFSCGKWEVHPDRASGFRVVSLQTIVEVPRAGTYTPLNEAHRFAFSTSEGGKPKLIYQISSQTPDVPTGTTFRCEATMEITADSLETDASICVHANTKKMSLAFSAIQFIATPRAIQDMKAGYVLLLSMVVEKLCGQSLPVSLLQQPAAVVSAPAEQIPAAVSEGAAEVQAAVPRWALLALLAIACATLLVLVVSAWTVSSSSADLDGIVSRLQQRNRLLENMHHSRTQDTSVASLSGSDASPLWDIVDAALREPQQQVAPQSTPDASLGGAGDAARLTRSQLSVLATQEALIHSALESLNEVSEQQRWLQARCDWMWWMWVVQFVMLIALLVKVFVL